jgi:hypothetical protein
MLESPFNLLKTVVAFAPTFNTKMALFKLIDFLDREEGEEQPSSYDVLEVIAQTIATLHHHVADGQSCEYDMGSGAPTTGGGHITEDEIMEFKRIMGLDKEDNNE